MRDPRVQLRATAAEPRPIGAEKAAAEAAPDVTSDVKAFTAASRNRIFTFLRAMAIGEYEAALAALSAPDQPGGEPWTTACLGQAMDTYYAGHERLCLDPNARNLRHTYVIPADDKQHWRVQQMLIDPDEHNDWLAEFEVDLAQSRLASEPVLRLSRLGPLVEDSAGSHKQPDTGIVNCQL